MTKSRRAAWIVTRRSSLSLPLACGNNNPPPPPPEQAGQSCAVAADCYSNLDGAALMGGAAVCIDKVPGGYCSHLCTVDTDCCAIAGECKTSYPQVCAPFESTPMQYCFLSCEDASVADAGVTDPNAFCATYAHAGLTCRSTGGGAKNRKVCRPEVGALLAWKRK